MLDAAPHERPRRQAKAALIRRKCHEVELPEMSLTPECNADHRLSARLPGEGVG